MISLARPSPASMTMFLAMFSTHIAGSCQPSLCLVSNILHYHNYDDSNDYILAKNTGIDGIDRPHQGVGPESGDENDIKRHAYYQWVPFMLFLQGVMFYIPHYLWKTFEDKKMDKITSGLRGKTFNTDGRRDACEHLISYLWETRGMHNAYAVK